jgi:hypothetical protein
MKKTSFIMLVLLLISCAATVVLQSKTEILRDIAAVENDPLSPAADSAYPVILRFAEKSKDVTVSISEKVLPWAGGKHTRELLGSFIAGNLKSQLASEKNEDDTYSGLTMMFVTYDRIKKSEPDFVVPEIEKQQALEATNELKQYLIEQKK